MGQLYGLEDVGKLKVDAMRDIITRLCGENNYNPLNQQVVINQNQLWETYVQMSDVVSTSFDSIAARQIVYEFWKQNGKDKSLFIDGRK